MSETRLADTHRMGDPKPPRRPTLHTVWMWTLTLGLGTAGGVIFFWVHMPLPWMLGSMLFTMVPALAGWRLGMPRIFRGTMLLVLGVMIGSAFTPDVLAHAGRWLISLGAMLVLITVATLLTQVYLHKAGGMDGITAFFAAAPGGLSTLVFMGAAMGGDERDIALIHSVRVLMVATVIPFGIRIAEHAMGGGGVPTPTPMNLEDMAILLACGVAGFGLAHVLRIPAPTLLGPMVLSAAAHLSNFTESRPPYVLIAVAQIVLGASIGCRFTGIPLRHIRRAVALSAGSGAVLLSAVLGMAWGLHILLGQSIEAAVLAYAPGGLPEMTIIALTLDIDVAFVAVHHLTRVTYIMLAAPLVFKAFPEWYRTPPSPVAVALAAAEAEATEEEEAEIYTTPPPEPNQAD